MQPGGRAETSGLIVILISNVHDMLSSNPVSHNLGKGMNPTIFLSTISKWQDTLGSLTLVW